MFRIALLSLLSFAAHAGSLHVSPTRIELTSKHPVATLEIRNSGNTRTTCQIERMLWTQPDGSDSYIETSELIATPAIFELEPGESQILRVGLRQPAPPTPQRAYRVYIREIPGATSSVRSELQVMLRVGVPVFTGAPGGKAELQGEILPNDDGSATLRVRNVGTTYLRALQIEARDPARGDVTWRTTRPAYLVAGGSYEWTEKPERPLAEGQQIRLNVLTDAGSQEETVVVAR